MMSKMKFTAFAVLAGGVACAMPTRQEIAESRPLVVEVMTPVVSEYKAQTKTAEEVADVSVGFAESAKNEATRYLLLRGAVGYYIKGGKFGKAADTIDAIKAKVDNVPPSEIVDIILGASGRESVAKSPRLNSQLQLARAQSRAMKDAGRLAAQLKKAASDPVRCQYAEALAFCGNWKAALSELSKVGGNVGKMAKAEMEGTAGVVELGDFWWGYETKYTGGELMFRDRAASYYRKAIAEGKIDGLKKTLVEQRLATLVLPDADSPAAKDAKGTKSDERKPPAPAVSRVPRAAKDASGLVHRWSFTNGFADSVGNIVPSKYGNAKAENGVVALQSGSPIEFPAGTVPLPPFTVQVWASATDKGLGAEDDFIFKIASAPDSKDDSVFWTWARYGKKWVSGIGAFEESKKVGHGKMLVDGQKHLYTVTAEKAGGGMLLRFYQDDTLFGEMKPSKSWKKPPMLILGGFVTPTYDEVRVYSRALTHAEIITSLNEGPDKVPELGKGK